MIPETLATCVLTASDLGPDSLQEMTLTTKGQTLWQNGLLDVPLGRVE